MEDLMRRFLTQITTPQPAPVDLSWRGCWRTRTPDQLDQLVRGPF